MGIWGLASWLLTGLSTEVSQEPCQAQGIQDPTPVYPCLAPALYSPPPPQSFRMASGSPAPGLEVQTDLDVCHFPAL